tara:strand:- start:4849 stop:6945 length:2097 start_codon:yes stop_codon:yes gene_type:complete
MSRVKGMEDGYGVPIVIIKDSRKKNLMSTDKGYEHSWAFNAEDLALSITNFVYQYIDDDEDECMITIETGNPKLADHPYLQEGKTLYAKWGYIGGYTVTRQIRITSLRCRYTEDKVIFDIKCNDSAAILSTLKLKKNQLIDQEVDSLTSFVAFYKATFQQGNFQFKIVKDGKVVVEKNELKELFNKAKTNKALGDTDIRLIKQAGDEDIPIMDFLLSLKMVDDGRSAKEMIDEAFASAPGGPYKIDTRDNSIAIHNRTTTFGGKAKDAYFYRGEKSTGDLLSFVSDIKDKTESIAATNGQAVDEDEKDEATQEEHNARESHFDIYGGGLNSRQTLRIIENGYFTLSEESKNELEDLANAGTTFSSNKFKRKIIDVYIEELMKRYEKDKELALTTLNFPEIQIINATTNIPGSKETTLYTDSTGMILEETKYVTEVDMVAGSNTGADYGGMTTTFRHDFIEFVNLPLLYTKLRNTIINIVRDKEMTSRTGDFIFIGDPNLKGRDLINLWGVATVHAGKHYIKKCKHQINSGGYRTSCETYQESPAVQKLLALFYKDKTDPSKTTYLDPGLSRQEFGGNDQYEMIERLTTLDAIKKKVKAAGIQNEKELEKHKANQKLFIELQKSGQVPLTTTFEEWSRNKKAIEISDGYGVDAGTLQDNTNTPDIFIEPLPTQPVDSTQQLQNKLDNLKKIKAENELRD